MFILVSTLVSSENLIMAKGAMLTVQQWGILLCGYPRRVSALPGGPIGRGISQDSNVLVRPLGEPKVTLAQKLAAFDPALHRARSWRRSLSATIVAARRPWCPDRGDALAIP
jgi:hypothetical protein